MPDAGCYPDTWHSYSKAVRLGKIKSSVLWNLYAARYRAASAYHHSEFMQFISHAIRETYSSVVGFLLSYTAFEECSRSAGEAVELQIISPATANWLIVGHAGGES